VGGASGAATCLPRGKAQPAQGEAVPWVVGTWGQGLVEEDVVVGVEWDKVCCGEGPRDGDVPGDQGPSGSHCQTRKSSPKIF